MRGDAWRAAVACAAVARAAVARVTRHGDIAADRDQVCAGNAHFWERWGIVRAMYRLVLVAIVAAAACTQSDNDRPATLEYITAAILQPSCGQYTCHSSFRRAKNYAFDTLEAARVSLAPIVNTDEPTSSFLYVVLIRKVKRMPYDAPLPLKDIDLILKWIEDGAPGLEAP